MKNILTVSNATALAKKLQLQQKTIVLCGGCFDILHLGHIDFLENAKKKGDVLFVMVESDETIKKTKGEKRPMFTQNDRAKMLSSLRFVDTVILLPSLRTDQEYDEIVQAIRPAIIAVTQHDPGVFHKKRQAKLVGAKVVMVNKKIPGISSTKLFQTLSEEL
ncbi:MAG: adenylyltransferase/cytidyltransferase family protein [Candidatus Levyibacteriota bacterium]